MTDIVAAVRRRACEMAAREKVRFIEAFVKIEDKDAPGVVVPFTLWPMQRELVAQLQEHRLSVILKARQLGISWLVLAFAASEMLGKEGYTVIALSRTEEEAKELVRRMEVIFANMPELIAPPEKKRAGVPWYEKKALEISVHWPGGLLSVFKGFPSAPSAARSFTANLIVFDEWAFQQWADEIWTAGFPTVNRPTGGKVIGLSSIERGSFFEEVFCGAPGNGFHPIFLPWNADPRRDAQWYAATRATLGDLIMQEYPASIEEALTVPGGAFFPEVKAHLHLRPPMAELQLVSRYACIDYGLDMLSVHWVWLDSEGNARVYREFDAPNMTISEAAREIRTRSLGDGVIAYLAPPDLWNRSQESGRSRADIFAENGVYLTRTSNDLAAGCAALKEWLRPRGEAGPSLTLDDGAAPELFRCLTKIQRDKLRPDIYAKEPHELTHDIDSLRCFAVFWTAPPEGRTPPRHRDFNFQRGEQLRSETGLGEEPSQSLIQY